MYEALSYECMRPEATIVCGLKVEVYAGLYVQVASLEEAAEDGLLAMLTVNTCAHLLAIAHSEGCGRLLDGCHVFALQVPPQAPLFAHLISLRISSLCASRHDFAHLSMSGHCTLPL